MAVETATFGAGCFWGVEARFRELPGVVDAAVGYMGGHTENPSYRQVCGGDTGHAEVVQVEYDPEQTTYEELLELFFDCHDPTTRNRQGPDVGSQYRSVIFTRGEAQAKAAQAAKSALEASARWPRPVVTEIAAAGPFWRAEEYHQQYLAKHGGGYCHT
ncbi:MAG: peptide-methionine (S)-S-oxide reductase MsrA [Xanthomonadales bacterium]|nr:peptide-methionine (S)-S-oxide reductase MsrA [Xanthomonadales bacterium]